MKEIENLRKKLIISFTVKTFDILEKSNPLAKFFRCMKNHSFLKFDKSDSSDHEDSSDFIHD